MGIDRDRTRPGRIRPRFDVDHGIDAGDEGIGGWHRQSRSPMRTRKPIARAIALAAVIALLGFSDDKASAQDANPKADNINAIRGASNFSAGDQRMIREWIVFELDRLGAALENGKVVAFGRFRSWFREKGYGGASTAFAQALAAQVGALAQERAGDAAQKPIVTRALARILVDMDHPATLPGLLAMLQSSDPIARFNAAKGLGSAALKSNIAADKDKLQRVVMALRKAGLAESQAVVLSRIYLALAYVDQVPAVADAYLALLEKRAGLRRTSLIIADGAEADAYEFFRTTGVLIKLTDAQKAVLVKHLAVLIRVDAIRYGASRLAFPEKDRLERMLDSEEAILSAIVGQPVSDVRDALSIGGSSVASSTLQAVYRWVGDPATQAPGVLNDERWKVPIGAP